MPRTYERDFRVRAYECDASGQVNHANYLRFMQEAAIEASSDLGYDALKYAELGIAWLIRETDITYHSPLFFGDHLVVRTWVDEVRGIRLHRKYVFLRAEQEEPVASAATDWILLDAESLRPKTIPEAIARVYLPDVPQSRRARRSPFPKLPPPPLNGPHVHRRRVAWRDLDHLGHVNNAVYLSYNEDAGLDLARKAGFRFPSFIEEGWEILAVRTQIEYRQPALLDDVLEIETWLSPPSHTSITRSYQVRRVSDGELLSRSQSTWVTVETETGRPIPIPDSFLRAFAANIGPG